jgi:hypothetical protein
MTKLLSELAALLHADTALDVQLSAPQAGQDVVFLWPWRIDSDQPGSPPRLPILPPGGVPPQSVSKIQLLLLVQNANLEESVSTLLACSAFINNNPVLRASEHQGQIAQSTLSNTDLFSLFLALNIKPQPCLSFTLTVLATQ